MAELYGTEQNTVHLKGNENIFSNAKLGLGRVEARIGDNLRPQFKQV